MTLRNTINLHLKPTAESHHILLEMPWRLVITNIPWKRQSGAHNNYYHYDDGADGDVEDTDESVD